MTLPAGGMKGFLFFCSFSYLQNIYIAGFSERHANTHITVCKCIGVTGLFLSGNSECKFI